LVLIRRRVAMLLKLSVKLLLVSLDHVDFNLFLSEFLFNLTDITHDLNFLVTAVFKLC